MMLGQEDPNGAYGTYVPAPAAQMEYHNFQDYPLNTSTPPSVMSDSPPPIRRTAQSVLPPLSGYEELDATLTQYQQFQADPNNPYGYITGPPVPAALAQSYAGPTLAGLSYENGSLAPMGYLDRRPSYADEQAAIYGQHSMYGQIGAAPPMLNLNPNGEAAIVDGGDGVRWRNPDLGEVIGFLSHPDPNFKANAAGYLQHLIYMDDKKKQQTRLLGGIPPLIAMLNEENPDVLYHGCGALRNLSFGRKNDENKRAIRNAGGLPSLIRLLRRPQSSDEIRDRVTGIMWNLSSCEDLKRPIIEEALSVLVSHIIIPGSGYAQGGEPSYWTNVFRNASGVLRNVSSAGELARRRMREMDGFVDSLIYLLRVAIAKNDIDGKSIENVVCILRNLSYRCQEVVDPNYDAQPPPGNTSNGSISNHNNSLSPSSSRAAAIMGSVGSKVGDNLGCFGGSKKKEKSKTPSASPSVDNHLSQSNTQPLTPKGNGTLNSSTGSRSILHSRPGEPTRGCDLLWQADIVQPYLALLSGCSNPETLEAAAGAIQNLSACYWQPSIDIRAAVRKEKGLPVLVELLRMEVDKVVCAVATALRNLAMDTRNKELIGKYAMKDLVSKLPNGNAQHDYGTSDDTIAAVLATLNEVISKNADFAKSLLEAQGMERLTYITKNKNSKHSPRVLKFVSQLLFNMWQHTDMREVYKKAGYKESSFIIRPATIARQTSSSSGAAGNTSFTGSNGNNTLSRPMSTQGGTKYEDRTLPRGHSARLSNNNVTRPEELPLNEMTLNQPDVSVAGVLSPQRQQQQHQQQHQQLSHRPPIGGVPIFPPGTGGTFHIPGPGEPVYAQVNRDRKKQQTSQSHRSDSSSTQALLGSDANAPGGNSPATSFHNVYDPNNEPIYPPQQPAGDSWV